MDTNATGSALIKALEAVWDQIKQRHPELPDVVIITGSGLAGRSPRWGHFWAERWATDVMIPAAESATEMEKLNAAVAELTARQNRMPELFIAGERLAAGAVLTVQTMLHEAAHALADVRDISDTSRGGRYHNRKFRELAEEIGLEYAASAPASTTGYNDMTMTMETRRIYADVILELKQAIKTFMVESVGTGKEPTKRAPSRNYVKTQCRCTPAHVVRMAPATLAAGVVKCGVCHSLFAEGTW